MFVCVGSFLVLASAWRLIPSSGLKQAANDDDVCVCVAGDMRGPAALRGRVQSLRRAAGRVGRLLAAGCRRQPYLAQEVRKQTL